MRMADAEAGTALNPSGHPGAILAAIVLAAGASTRLGRPKQLLLYQGEPLLRRSVRLALEAGAGPVWAVIRPDDAAACRSALDGLSVTVLENPNPEEGMGSSLRLTMAALLAARPVPDRVLLLVCDQPLLTTDSLRRLVAAPSPHGIAAAGYSGGPGVPAVFDRRHFAALAEAAGDQGARTLLRTLPVTAVPMPEATLDIDTSADLERLEGEG